MYDWTPLRAVSRSGFPRQAVGRMLLERARWVDQELDDAQRLGLSLQEETITESLLLNLCRALPDNLRARAFSRHEENRETGADWEWWFGDGPGSTWFGMRVQAKKLKRQSGGVAGYDLGYASASGRRQAELLVHAASEQGMPSVFALYNGPLLDLSLFGWPCCHFTPQRPTMGVALLGGPTGLALAARGATNQAAVIPFSKPWSCLLLCPDRLSHTPPVNPPPLEGVDGSIATFAADLVGALYEAGEAQFGGRQAEESFLMPGGRFSHEEAPEYVRRLSGATDLAPFDAEGVPEDLAGLLVTTTAWDGPVTGA